MTLDETRTAGDDGKHKCPYVPCERRVSMHLFACRAHWMKVPAHLRAALYAAFNGNAATYLEVRAECVEAMNAR
jgi:hypothetical protein